MKEKNKALHIAILIIGVIVYLFLFMITGPLAKDSLLPYFGVFLQIQVIICALIVTTNRKRGFIVDMALCALNLMSAASAAAHGTTTAFTAVLVSLISAAILFIIFTFLDKIDTQSAELAEQYEQITDSNRTMQETDEALRQLAYTDGLTGLNNMRWLYEQTEKAIQEKPEFSLLYLDIDNFKYVNDTYGSKIGVVAVKIYAERLSALCQNQYQFARSGDDFGILLTDGQSKTDILTLVEQLGEVFSKPVSIQGAKFNMTASYGIASYPHDGNNSEELFDNAIMAVYNAKANGKARAYFFSQG